jgi:FtsZ-binding cell division protein ZapB
MAKPNQKPSFAFLPLLLVSAVVLPGCDFVAGLAAYGCQFSSDSPHCYQDAAVQSGNPDDCDKVAQKEEFKKLGSNPPQDKCRMMVAANKEDPKICGALKGGPMSYTKEDCEETIAQTATRPETCGQISGSAVGTCVDTVSGKMYAEVDALAAKPNKTPDEIQALQQKMEQLGQYNEMMTSVMKADYESKKALIGNMR